MSDYYYNDKWRKGTKYTPTLILRSSLNMDEMSECRWYKLFKIIFLCKKVP